MPYKVIDGKIEPLTFTGDEVIQKSKDEKIKFLNLQFTVMNRILHHHTTMAANMFRKEDFKMDLPKLDCSSICIFTEIYDCDL